MAKKIRETSERGKSGAFSVGDGVHWSFNGDSYPGTVRRISPNGKKLSISKDEYRCKQTDHLTEGDREAVFSPQDVPETEWLTFTLRKSGEFTDHPKYGWNLYPRRAFASNPHF